MDTKIFEPCRGKKLPPWNPPGGVGGDSLFFFPVGKGLLDRASIWGLGKDLGGYPPHNPPYSPLKPPFGGQGGNMGERWAKF